MKSCILLFCFLFCGVLSLQGAWYWPFDTDPDSTNKPPRLHRLLVKANNTIEEAEDLALKGESEKAIASYRKALQELDRVEQENPGRAASPEFAPLRNKRATCNAAIDAIRFAQVSENERAVSITDTKDLEKKWREKHKMTDPTPAPTKTPLLVKQLQEILKDLQAGSFVIADRQLDQVLEKNPKNLSALLLRATAQMGMRKNEAARRTLEQATREHPKSYLPLYNLAKLALHFEGNPKRAKSDYEKGRALGGPRQEDLEKNLP